MQENQFGGISEQRLRELDQRAIKWMKSYVDKRNKEIEKRRERGGLEDYEVRMKISHAINARQL
jgi:hypothetical protein